MPTLTLLDEAMLRAGRMVPAVHRLGGGQIAMAGSQQPWRVVGAESVVYQLRQPNGRVLALRSPLSDTPDPALADRYRALGNENTLRRLRAGGASPIVGMITFIADGISLPGSELRSMSHPVIGMDWVMGPTLLAAADRACRGRDRDYLIALAEAWRAAMESLHAVQFVHGNLTGDNAMVRPREGIALVDYDTATWPGGPRSKQTGARPGYRHPIGIASLPEHRDDFAALVIYTSLRILARWPELREEHGDPATQLGGTLLFSAHDLANPDGSALFGKIRVVDDPEVQTLVAALREASRRKPDETPSFVEVARGALRAARHIATPPPALKPLPHQESEKERQVKLSRLKGYLLAGDEDGARHYMRASGLIDDPKAQEAMGLAEIERRRAPRAARPKPSLEYEGEAAKPGAERAKQRSAALDQLRRALERGDAGEVGRLWPQVRNDPGASVYAAQVHEALARLFGAAITSAIERGSDAAIIETVAGADAAGFAVPLEARRALRAAEARTASRQRLQAALAADDREVIAEMALRGELDELGDFDAATTHQIMRALATPHLLRAVASDDDAVIYAAYDAEVFGGTSGLPPEVAGRVILAVNRVRWSRTVRAALKSRDVSALERAFDTAPEGGPDQLTRAERDRIERIFRHRAAREKLLAAVAHGDDDAIVAAVQALEASGATMPPELDRRAISGVIERLSLMTSIKSVLKDPEQIDYSRLARLLAQARAEAGGATPNLGPGLDVDHLEREVWRAARRARIREALKTGDNRAIASAALPDLYGAISSLAEAEREQVMQAVEAVRASTGLTAASERGPAQPVPVA